MLRGKKQELLKQFQSNHNWLKKSYQVRFFPWSVQIHAVTKMMKAFSWSQRFGGTIGQDSMQHWLWNADDLTRVRNYFIEQVLVDSYFFSDFEEGFLQAWKNFLEGERKYIREYDPNDISKMISYIRQLIDLETEIGKFGYVNDCFLTTGGSDWLLAWIDKELPLEILNRDQVIADLVTPIIPSFVQQEEIDRLRIANAPRNQWETLLTVHREMWHWIENSYWESEPLTKNDFLKKIQVWFEDHKEVSQMLTERRDISAKKQARKQDLYTQFGFSKTLQTVIELSERISHLTDIRKQGVLRMNGHIWKFFKDLSVQTGQPFDLLVWMDYEEMEEIIQKKDWETLRERREKGMILLVKDGEKLLIQGDDFLGIDLSPFLDVDGSIRELTGQIACKGYARGVARIIRGRVDFSHFEDGNILITNQTTPEFISLMKRAGAVITEQGGITCHAAIVSRELHIPCVIGVSDAMKIFVDGQMIEVDAHKGIIRKI